MPNVPVQARADATGLVAIATSVNFHPDALIRLPQILGKRGQPPLLACGRTQFYLWIKQGKLPAPRKVGHASFWRAGDILAALGKLG